MAHDADEKPGTARLWASCLGAGFAPVAPGTAGSAVAALVHLCAALTLDVPELAVFCLGACLLASAITLGDGNRVRQELEEPDPQLVVSDEFAGMFLAFFLAAAIPTGFSVVALTIVIFLLFRVFDGLKPFGIRKLEPLPAGWGVLLDDLAAGVLAVGSAQLLAGLVRLAGLSLQMPAP